MFFCFAPRVTDTVITQMRCSEHIVSQRHARKDMLWDFTAAGVRMSILFPTVLYSAVSAYIPGMYLNSYILHTATGFGNGTVVVYIVVFLAGIMHYI